jgi:DNA-directed RNA polymerase subunit K/omega
MDADYLETNGMEDGGVDIDILAELGGDVPIVEQNLPDPSLGYLYAQHPETILEYVEEVIPKLSVKPDDVKHISMPYLTTFERTKILGFRSTQLSQGARPFITIPSHVTDVKDVARLELEARRLPFIVKRPMPDGTFEYWRLSDLAIL